MRIEIKFHVPDNTKFDPDIEDVLRIVHDAIDINMATHSLDFESSLYFDDKENGYVTVEYDDDRGFYDGLG